MDKCDIERTESGSPALWEKSGGYTNAGYAVVIAGKNGEPPPIF